MIISVTSPVHGQAGNTTIALLTALLLAQTNKSVCLTHLSPQSSAFHSYLGLDALTDKTCTPSQAVKLLREGAIEPHDMADYCYHVCENLDIFSNNSKAFSEDDMEITQKYILENMPHDFVVLDIDINTKTPLAKLAKSKTDIDVICITQSLNVAERYAEIFPEKPTKNTLFLCNHYSPDVSSVAAFAKSLGAKPKDCCTLHHSALLMKMANAGKLGDILSYAGSIPLPDVDADFKALLQTITRSAKALARPPLSKRTSAR